MKNNIFDKEVTNFLAWVRRQGFLPTKDITNPVPGYKYYCRGNLYASVNINLGTVITTIPYYGNSQSSEPMCFSKFKILYQIKI